MTNDQRIGWVLGATTLALGIVGGFVLKGCPSTGGSMRFLTLTTHTGTPRFEGPKGDRWTGMVGQNTVPINRVTFGTDVPAHADGTKIWYRAPGGGGTCESLGAWARAQAFRIDTIGERDIRISATGAGGSENVSFALCTAETPNSTWSCGTSCANSGRDDTLPFEFFSDVEKAWALPWAAQASDPFVVACQIALRLTSP